MRKRKAEGGELESGNPNGEKTWNHSRSNKEPNNTTERIKGRNRHLKRLLFVVPEARTLPVPSAKPLRDCIPPHP
jgi:hypothetical protein